MNCSEIAAAAPLYRSGELDPVRAAEFSGHLAACPDCARELRRQAQLDDLLRASVLADAVDTAVLNRRVRERIAAHVSSPSDVISAARPPRWRIAAIGSVAAMLLLAVGYRHLFRPRSVYADAAADHRSEVVNAHRRTWITDPAAIAALAERNGVEPRAVLALAPPGYHLARAKLCPLDGRPFLHLVYSNGAGEFSAYLRPRDAQAPAGGAVSRAESDRPVYISDFGAEHLGCVETPGLTAVIVTDESADAASSLAHFAGVALASPAANF